MHTSGHYDRRRKSSEANLARLEGDEELRRARRYLCGKGVAYRCTSDPPSRPHAVCGPSEAPRKPSEGILARLGRIHGPGGLPVQNPARKWRGGEVMWPPR
jgi:hypothetical protein